MIADRLENGAFYREFINEIEAGRVHNAYLIVSEDELAGRIMLELVSKALLSDCFRDKESLKLFREGTHPDLHIYNRDKKITVSDAENIIMEAQKSGWASERRLFVIDNAEKAGADVQNKLLKIMEEPPEGAVLIFRAVHEGALLETVRSRVKLMRLPLASDADVEAELKGSGVPAGVAGVAARLAGGNYALATAYAEEEGLEEDYSAVFSMLSTCKKTKDMAPFVYGGMFTAERIGRILDFTELILRDVMADIAGAPVRRYTYNRDAEIESVGAGFTPGGLAMAILAVNEARKMEKVNISPETIGEKLLFDILEAKYKWRKS